MTRPEVVLTGRAPVWLYLALAHHFHGVVRKLWYDSPLTGRVLIWDHSPD
jgi:CRISPR-associated Csx3 family protein